MSQPHGNIFAPRSSTVQCVPQALFQGPTAASTVPQAVVLSTPKQSAPGPDPVKVVVRLKPLPQGSNSSFCARIQSAQSVSLFPSTGDKPASSASRCLPRTPSRSAGAKLLTFDQVFDTNCDSATVFQQSVSPLISSALDGYNVTVFAYGATGSGKTHTLMGSSTPERTEDGVIPRALRVLFAMCTARASATKHTISLSYIEFYNNTFKDLLDKNNLPESQKAVNYTPSKRLRMRTSQAKGAHFDDAITVTVKSAQEAMQHIQAGERARAFGVTNYNEHSSRSHAIVTVFVHTTDVKTGRSTHSKIHLVDLAGNEPLSTSTERNASLVEETRHINSSLSVLNRVIAQLSRKAKSKTPCKVAVNYRDNKLTYFLKDSLGGNSKSLMICTVHSEGSRYQHTKRSLEYAAQARSIQNTPSVNEDPIPAPYAARPPSARKRAVSASSSGASADSRRARQSDAERQELTRLRRAVEAKQKECRRALKDKSAVEAKNEHLSRNVEALERERKKALAKLQTLQDELDQTKASPSVDSSALLEATTAAKQEVEEIAKQRLAKLQQGYRKQLQQSSQQLSVASATQLLQQYEAERWKEDAHLNKEYMQLLDTEANAMHELSTTYSEKLAMLAKEYTRLHGIHERLTADFASERTKWQAQVDSVANKLKEAEKDARKHSRRAATLENINKQREAELQELQQQQEEEAQQAGKKVLEKQKLKSLNSENQRLRRELEELQATVQEKDEKIKSLTEDHKLSVKARVKLLEQEKKAKEKSKKRKRSRKKKRLSDHEEISAVLDIVDQNEEMLKFAVDEDVVRDLVDASVATKSPSRVASLSRLGMLGDEDEEEEDEDSEFEQKTRRRRSKKGTKSTKTRRSRGAKRSKPSPSPAIADVDSDNATSDVAQSDTDGDDTAEQSELNTRRSRRTASKPKAKGRAKRKRAASKASASLDEHSPADSAPLAERPHGKSADNVAASDEQDTSDKDSKKKKKKKRRSKKHKQSEQPQEDESPAGTPPTKQPTRRLFSKHAVASLPPSIAGTPTGRAALFKFGGLGASQGAVPGTSFTASLFQQFVKNGGKGLQIPKLKMNK